MTNILDDIIAEKREEVQQRQSQVSLEQLRERIAEKPRCRNFYKAVTKPNGRGINVIAEVKKASPSAGLIREDFDPVAIARAYERCGADAISVLTDEKYFQGRLEYLEQVKEAVALPVLRKDFIIDIWQVYESRAAGADAILLIAEALRPGDLIDLMIAAAELGLTVLLEVHEADTLMAVRSLIGFPKKGYSVLGINNRDLTTMNVDIRTTARLSSLLDDDCELVSESGIKTPADVRKLKSLGIRAVLVGQTLCGGTRTSRRNSANCSVEPASGPRRRAGSYEWGRSGSVIVPEVSRFLGIVIAMYYREHAPPHFHAKYGRQRAQFSIADLRIIEGKLPPRVISLVLEWAFQHREELLENWDLAERKEGLHKIRPLV